MSYKIPKVFASAAVCFVALAAYLVVNVNTNSIPENESGSVQLQADLSSRKAIEANASTIVVEKNAFSVKSPTYDAIGGEARRTASLSEEANKEQTDYNSIVVPNSYPVSSAEKYFVPRNKRTLQNMGGPPPRF